jgi:peroxiredoxin Q/BCP
MLKPGDRAPDFDAKDQEDRVVRLSSLLASGPVVLYFYPRDFTRVCTAQACLFRDAHSELQALGGAQVVGVNVGDATSHGAFSRKHQLNFPLVVDEGGRIARAYGVNRPLGLFTKRVTFVIAADGVVRGVFHHELSAERHLEDVRNALAALPTS